MVEFEVEVPGEPLEPASFANAVLRAVATLDLSVSLETTVARSPGSLHWHIKKFGRTGTVEVTAMPRPLRLWVSYHSNRIGDGWVQDVARQLAEEIARNL